MAVPTETLDRSIFVIGIKMGSPNQSKGRDIDDFIRELTYKKPKAERLQIGKVRQSINVVVDGTCMKFFGVKITNQAGKETLERECSRADAEMKKIDSTLHVTPVFFEVKVSSMSAGNMFDQMKEQLSVQVHQKVLDRVESAIENSRNPDGSYKPMTGKTRTALIAMLDKVKEINVLGDDNVDGRIEAMKAQITAGSLIPMRDEILALIEDVQGSENLEISPDQTESEHDPDDTAYESKPFVPSAQDEIALEDLI